MHVRSSLFVNARRGLPVARLAAGACACALLSACVANPWVDGKVDPRSPIAVEVAKSVRADASYPTFQGIPPVPKDIRPHRQYGQDAAQTEKDAAALMAATADSTWTLQNTQDFANAVRADAGPALPPADPNATAAFAKDQKARATAPPPAKR